MAITQVRWDGEGYDIHLLKGEKSIPLAQKLFAVRNFSSEFRGDHPPSGVTVEFVAEFKGAPSNHGVTLGADGQVTVAGSLPSPRLYNFIVTATVSESGSNRLTTQIRVHIHDTITKIWLTPSTLTLYLGGAKQRFTVLAEFSDRTFGDITDRNSTVVLNNQNRLKFIRIPDPAGNISVDANTGEVTALQANANQDVHVSILLNATTPELPDEQQSLATVNTKPPLASARTITRVRPQGPVNFAQKVNILFIADGFQSGEKDLFNRIIDGFVENLQNGLSTLPYNLLKDSINYWRLQDAHFLPSAEQNVSMLGELAIVGRRTISGRLVPFPIKPPDSLTSLSIEHMVYTVGLPVPSDTRTLAQLETLYDRFFVTRVKTKVFNEWRALGDRKLINERDTAFGIALHDHPRVDSDADRIAAFHGRRTTDSQFVAFVAALQDGGATVGATWTTGKDKGLMCLVARSERTGGTKVGNVFCFTLGNSLEDKLQAATGGRRGIDQIPMKLTDAGGTLITFDPAVVTTIAHECAHAFGLEDEYGGGLTLPEERKKNILSAGNVQPASELTAGLLNKLDQQHIRWLLPRIKAAGVLSATPTVSGGNLTVTLATTRTDDFFKEDIVRFRKRGFLTDTNPSSGLNSSSFRVIDVQGDDVSINPLGATIAPGEFPSGSLMIDLNRGIIAVTVAEPSSSVLHGGNALDVSLKPGYSGGFNIGAVVALRKNPFSERFKVAAAPVGNQLTLTPLAGATLPPFISTGDLLIATVPASLSPLGNDLTLIAPIILSHLATKKGPLNAPPGSPTRACTAATEPFGVMTPQNLPAGLPKDRPTNKANIVGLYEGGNEFDCGVFHPTGLCLFRTNPGPRTARFCQVCRYLIVDRVDPMLHKELDQIYKLEYPEP